MNRCFAQHHVPNTLADMVTFKSNVASKFKVSVDYSWPFQSKLPTSSRDESSTDMSQIHYLGFMNTIGDWHVPDQKTVLRDWITRLDQQNPRSISSSALVNSQCLQTSPQTTFIPYPSSPGMTISDQ